MANLVYTLALEQAGAPGHRMLGKLLASSLLRTFFDGDVVVFRNRSAAYFQVERRGLAEVEIEGPTAAGAASDRAEDHPSFAREAWNWKYRARKELDVRGYDKVMYVDADCLALRNVDHLLEGDWDIAYQPQAHAVHHNVFNAFLTAEEMAESKRVAAMRRGVPPCLDDEEFHEGRGVPPLWRGINAGTFAVRSGIFHEVMDEYERIDSKKPLRDGKFHEQGAWNRLIRDVRSGNAALGGELPAPLRGLRVKPFEAGEIMFPIEHETNYATYKDCCMVHALGLGLKDKMRFLFGLYMGTFFFDENGMMLNLLEM
jgi:hypothetical protein